MKKPTLKEAITELKRELYMRSKVYPKQIALGKLDKGRANQQYLRLEHALTLLQELQPIKKKPEQKRLF